MIKKNAAAREIIITAAMKLIERHGDTSIITIRDIAARAGVGTGLINYHFQTKENLINICVQRIINLEVEKFEPLYKSLDVKPADKLRLLAKSTCAFLAANPGISRVSILTDLQAGNADDNSIQVQKAYLPLIKEVCGGKKTDGEAQLLLHMLLSSIQVAFLRKDVLIKTADMDFSSKEQRDAYVDSIIDILFS